jgi:hypothetical protein
MADLTVDIIETFIDSLSIGGEINSYVVAGGNTTITVDNIYHARFKMPINIDAVEYEILSVNHTLNTITLIGEPATPAVFTLNNPFYFHGTALATNSHISNLDDASKVPMIYLHETLRERVMSEANAIDKESELRLFVLDAANFGDWTTDQHYSIVILGLNKLVEFLIQKIRDYFLFYMFETEITQINHVKWGQFTDLKGHVQSIFNDHLTGIELSFTLPIRKCD